MTIFNYTVNYVDLIIVGIVLFFGFVGLNKGIFITTSNFAPAAKDAAKKGDIRLIDGDQLLDLLFKYHVLIEEEENLPIYRFVKDEEDD